jgi:acetyltransferase
MLESLFRPKSAAVIGASSKELSIGNRVIKNLIDFGFKGEIYPINPKADEIRGIKAYKSIMDCPDGIDVVHMVIPAKFVPQAMDDCGKKGVKNVIINSGGFSEIGPEGDALEKEFLATARPFLHQFHLHDAGSGLYFHCCSQRWGGRSDPSGIFPDGRRHPNLRFQR